MGCGTIAALTLMGAGTGVSEYANVATKNKMNELSSAEQQRQKGFQQQGTDIFHQSLGQSGAPQAQQQIQQGVQQSLGATQQASKIPFGTSTAPLPGKQGNNLADLQLKSQLGLGQQANANLMGYGNYGFQQGLKDQNVGGQLGIVNREAQQSAGALPTELNSAQSQYAGLQGLGQLLDVAGMLTGLYGLTAAPAASQGAAGAFDWSNPASWGAAYIQPYGATGALQILPSY